MGGKVIKGIRGRKSWKYVIQGIRSNENVEQKPSLRISFLFEITWLLSLREKT